MRSQCMGGARAIQPLQEMGTGFMRHVTLISWPQYFGRCTITQSCILCLLYLYLHAHFHRADEFRAAGDVRCRYRALQTRFAKHYMLCGVPRDVIIMTILIWLKTQLIIVECEKRLIGSTATIPICRGGQT